MIKFENTEVMNFEAALRGMRNPLNSWDKSDTGWIDDEDYEVDDFIAEAWKEQVDGQLHRVKVIGENDMTLAKKLIAAGSDHRKFLRQIFVSVDITAPLYWWKEFDTYKVGTVANSCSTMHTIHKKEFTREDFSCEHLIDNWIGDNVEAVSEFKPELSEDTYPILPTDVLDITINALNSYREAYLRYSKLPTKDLEKHKAIKKKLWQQMIQLLPSSYNQKRTITMTYENLRNMYHARRNHKLDEWRVGFMEWIDTLPYADELIKS